MTQVGASGAELGVISGTTGSQDRTEVGSYFISNYPPFSVWNADSLAGVRAAMSGAPSGEPLGLYLHIPFCRKRCKFCYFRVYTDKRADEIEVYLAALAREIELVRRLPVLGEREVRFVYFGGGTPSFLSVRQLESLFARIRANLQWDKAEEVTFECEPGTLSESKVHALRDLGITRLSLGIENFSDAILEENGRAHLSAEIERSWEWITAAGFPNVNVDLIAGMVGETDENWTATVERACAMRPDSLTIYQMELPYNTVYSREILGEQKAAPVASWSVKRRWVREAYERFQAAGYHVSSAYTLVRDPARVNFSYRDHLWHGSDLLATGVASFGHVSGAHYQNAPDWPGYVGALEQGELPLHRGLVLTADQALIRQVVLLLKRGSLDLAYFRAKFQVDVLAQWRSTWESLARDGMIDPLGPDKIVLSRQGLIQVDSLLPEFFEPQFRNVRYT